jgi:hypothetical protein
VLIICHLPFCYFKIGVSTNYLMSNQSLDYSTKESLRMSRWQATKRVLILLLSVETVIWSTTNNSLVAHVNIPPHILTPCKSAANLTPLYATIPISWYTPPPHISPPTKKKSGTGKNDLLRWTCENVNFFCISMQETQTDIEKLSWGEWSDRLMVLSGFCS